MVKTMITGLVLCVLLLGYQPTPSPPLDPNDVPFIYDPNQCLSEPMIALIIRIGSAHVGEIKVIEPDGDPVTVSLMTGDNESGIIVDSNPFYNVKDPNDPLGIARIYRFTWRWTPAMDDEGLHYVNVRVSDQYDAFDERTMIVLVKENRPPVITGCR